MGGIAVSAPKLSASLARALTRLAQLCESFRVCRDGALSNTHSIRQVSSILALQANRVIRASLAREKELTTLIAYPINSNASLVLVAIGKANSIDGIHEVSTNASLVISQDVPRDA